MASDLISFYFENATKMDDTFVFYGGPQLSRQNQKCHGKTKNFTARTKYLTAKPKTGVANGKCETLRDGETSVFLCEPETF